MKICPVCNARCFDDMEVCYGCMHRFGEEPGVPDAPVEVSEPPRTAGLPIDQVPPVGQGALAGAAATPAVPPGPQRMAIPMVSQVPQASQAAVAAGSAVPLDAALPTQQPFGMVSLGEDGGVAGRPSLALGAKPPSGGSSLHELLPGYRLEIRLVPIQGAEAPRPVWESMAEMG